MHVPGCNPRMGSSKDVETIKELFGKKLGYKIMELHDPGLREYDKFVQDLQTTIKNDGCDLFLFIMMSHGKGKKCLLSDGNKLHYIQDIVMRFLNGCLQDKPKLFLLQFCRGEAILKAPQPRNLAYDGPDDDKTSIDTEDIYVLHSTFPGFRSIRDPQSGTWFIQEFCKVLQKSDHSTEFMTLKRTVIHNLTSRREPYYDEQGKEMDVRQTPTGCMDTLHRPLLLKPQD
ncbi:hypothetical protein BOX15_Mlig000746g2 [Macrostomum lignano]|uniref:Caspase family p20 domain-containing protein n=1 Tax=Macrostomum lignano TaxID=282301 RepID=A0A267FB49_9PLAT|nr:hypothetical protein BOX15_Mlig000746g2 [Macrostomum lignano]